MAITIDDFSKIWASTSPLTPYEFSENNYKQGWNFIGSTPPSRQMWDFLQKNNDEKMQYLADNYLPLSGGTMTGTIKGNPITLTADDGNGNTKDFIANSNGSLKWNGKPVLYGENASYGSNGYFIINNINTVIQWRRASVSNGASVTWTYLVPFADNDYIRFVSTKNAFSFSTTATTMTVTNNGSSSTEIDMMAIGLMA